MRERRHSGEHPQLCIKHLAQHSAQHSEEHTSSRIDHRHLEHYLRCQKYTHKKHLLPPLLLSDDLSSVHNCNAFSKWNRQHQPDAIISNLDELPFLKKLKIKIPDELGYISLDVQANHPTISGIDQNAQQVGACAINNVIAKVYSNERGLPIYPEFTQIPPIWQEGASIQTPVART